MLGPVGGAASLAPVAPEEGLHGLGVAAAVHCCRCCLTNRGGMCGAWRWTVQAGSGRVAAPKKLAPGESWETESVIRFQPRYWQPPLFGETDPAPPSLEVADLAAAAAGGKGGKSGWDDEDDEDAKGAAAAGGQPGRGDEQDGEAYESGWKINA